MLYPRTKSGSQGPSLLLKAEPARGALLAVFHPALPGRLMGDSIRFILNFGVHATFTVTLVHRPQSKVGGRVPAWCPRRRTAVNSGFATLLTQAGHFSS